MGAVDSWPATLGLAAVAATIVVFYLIGRLVAEALRGFAASGALPSF